MISVEPSARGLALGRRGALSLIFALVCALLAGCGSIRPLVLDVRVTNDSALPAPTATASYLGNDDSSYYNANYSAVFIEDVTIPDDTDMLPGQPFVKTWRVRNTGYAVWRGDVRIELQYGDVLGSAGRMAVPVASYYDDVDISVEMVAPEEPGWYISYWQLCTDDGLFGPEMWVSIYVDGMSAEMTHEGSNS